jgi:DNA-binding response OmpR family regulator
MQPEKTHILIVEDESIVANELKSTLEKLGFEVCGITSSYKNTLDFLKKHTPDLVFLDINLKDEHTGIDIAKVLNFDYGIPFIYLSDYTHDTIIKQAVETEPVTYLAKPFRREHIQSAVLLFKYKQTHDNTTYHHPKMTSLGYDYFYDLKEGNLYYKTFPIKLSPKEKKLLELLIQARRQIVQYSVLEYEIWDGNPVSQSALRTLCWRLNIKLEHKIIENIPTFGYKLHSM